jgi:hypothetical protein
MNRIRVAGNVVLFALICIACYGLLLVIMLS